MESPVKTGENIFTGPEDRLKKRILENKDLRILILIDADQQAREFHRIKWLIDQRATNQIFHILMVTGSQTKISTWPTYVTWSSWVKALTHTKNAADTCITFLSTMFSIQYYEKYKIRLNMFALSNDNFIFGWQDVMRALFPGGQYFAIDPWSVDAGLAIVIRFRDDPTGLSIYGKRMANILKERYKQASGEFPRDDSLLMKYIQMAFMGYLKRIDHLSPQSIYTLDEIIYAERNNKIS